MIVAVLCGLFKLAQPLDHIYWNARFKLGQSQAPDSVVLVTVDNESAWRGLTDPQKADLLRTLSRQAPKNIYLDEPLDISRDSQLARAIRDLGPRVTVIGRVEFEKGKPSTLPVPGPDVIGNARVAYSGWYLNLVRFAQGTLSSIEVSGRQVPALAVLLADEKLGAVEAIIPDFSMNPDTLRTVKVADILGKELGGGLLTGRSVIITSSQPPLQSRLGYFGHRFVNPIALDIAASLNASRGATPNIGEIPAILFLGLGLYLCTRVRNRQLRWYGYAVVAATVVFGTALLQKIAGIFSIPSPAIIGLVVFAGLKMWSKWRRRVLQTSASGLPNFAALAEQAVPAGHDIVVATIGRYEEFLAMLPSSLHGECARQIARRFAVGSNVAQIYHGDGGHFAWIEASNEADLQLEHFEGLRALFSAPLLVGGHIFDTNVHFGLDRNQQLDTLTRLNTALVSANEAMRSGRAIQQFEAQRLVNAPFELSLLARIDEGMKNGDIWVAYQPQWDYRHGRISGAEALVRWNDPQRGPIPPDEFIVQAENAGRIDALTYWVLEQAICATQDMAALGANLQMAVNLSALMVDKPGLVSSLSEIVRRRGVDCRNFTIEVTETASVYNRPAAVQNLQQLRAMGFRLAIDDFGTGESSLLYLAELPSDELKIDKHFVSRIRTGPRERQIVASTIRLAHALRQTVVAEGIEDQETFELLRRMGCDTGQGYYIARPGTFEQLRARYLAEGGRAANS